MCQSHPASTADGGAKAEHEHAKVPSADAGVGQQTVRLHYIYTETEKYVLLHRVKLSQLSEPEITSLLVWVGGGLSNQHHILGWGTEDRTSGPVIKWFDFPRRLAQIDRLLTANR